MAEASARFIGLAHIGVATEDIEESIRFYTQHLGFTVWRRSESGSKGSPNKLALLQQGTCVVESEELSCPGQAERSSSYLSFSINRGRALKNRLRFVAMAGDCDYCLPSHTDPLEK